MHRGYKLLLQPTGRRKCQQLFQQLSSAANSRIARQRICIVGAGPAGFYAAQYILKQLKDCEVHMMEKLPVPFGLVRFGVAPDHPEVKNVINTFTKTALNERFHYYGNVSLGRDVSLQELRDAYHAVLLSYGADQDRCLGIPNESQPHVWSARDFVAWYNGQPGAERFQPDLSRPAVLIIGQGNVAMDVARMLLNPVDTLRHTDTTEYALEALSRSAVQSVYMVGRRGPLQAAFTIKELREMLKLPNVQTVWRPDDFVDVAAQLEGLQRPRKRLTELMLKSLAEQTAPCENKRQFLPVFQRAPKSIGASDMEFTVTELKNNSAVLTDATERLPADIVLRSIGYQATCTDAGICFDKSSGRVFNHHGRVLKSATASDNIDPGLYVAGWLATGPTGVILTTMNNAFAVAKNVCDDFLSNVVDSSVLKPGLTLDSGKRVVTWQHWERIDRAEITAGCAKGKPREKFVDVEEMLKCAGL